MDDFVSPVMRQAFRQICRMAMGESLRATADDDAWLSVIADHEAPGHLDTGDDIRLREEAVRTALRMREQGLARERTGVSQMVESARQNGDAEALARYNQELRQILGKLLRSQRALQLRGNLQIG
jgi:hypothetical protein